MANPLAALLLSVESTTYGSPTETGERSAKRARKSAGGSDANGDLRMTFVGGRHAFEFNMTPKRDFIHETNVPFEKPKEIAVCSRDKDGVWTSDASAISKYSPPNCEGDYCDLKRGYERWQHEELGRAELTFEPVMQAVWDAAFPSRAGAAAATSGTPLPPAAPTDPGAFPANVVMWRGQMSKLLCAPYSTREDWEMSVYAVDGVVYIDARETEACQRRKVTPTATQRLSTYQGYKFESYCTDQPRESSVNTKPGVAYCSVATTEIGGLRLILAGEVDCYSAEPAADNYMELKTSKIFSRDNVHARENFEKNKLLKYWAQSYTVGVPRVVVGFRTDNGIVKKVQRFYTTQIPRMVQGREDEMWDARICLGFAYRVLAWISHVVLASDPAKDAAAAGAASGSAAPGPHEAPDQSQCWLLRFEGDDSTRLTLQIDHPRKAHHIYAATRVYEAVKPQHAASLASSEGGAAAIS
jgi:hypothetical protein